MKKNTKIVNYTKSIDDNTYFFLAESDKIEVRGDENGTWNNVHSILREL